VAASRFTRAELGVFIVLGGVLVLVAKAPPVRLRRRFCGPGPELAIVFAPALPSVHTALQMTPALTDISGALLLQILLFFAKTATFAFGSGLATIPFLEQGVVRDYGWLTEQQFLDVVPMMVVSHGL
jgi:chromate transporter